MNEEMKNIPENPESSGENDLELIEAGLPLNDPKITVLLVDDKEMIGNLIGRMLKSEEDIDFHYCRSAQEAMRVANDICPTVILQDLVMPEIDGLYMVKYFRSKKKTQHTPLIMLSAEEDAKMKARAFALGANDYIVKLPDKVELIARIRYHSRAYINMLQRDAAYIALSESMKRAEYERKIAEAAIESVMDSIRYARMIQSSMLPSPEDIHRFLPDSFFIWMPKDIVSGDFIFTDFFAGGLILAVIDCTGHGVPGAFMTMVAIFALKKIIRDTECHDPAQILNQLNVIVKTTLHQNTKYALSNDGLDAAVVTLRLPEPMRKKPETDCEISGHHVKNLAPCCLTFAGAKLPLIYVLDGVATVIRGDRQSVGYRQSRWSDIEFEFTNHTVELRKGMSFYMFSDGFGDQLGGNKRRPFGSRRLKEMLTEHARLPFEKQRENFLRVFNEYKGKNEMQDDVTFVGFGF